MKYFFTAIFALTIFMSACNSNQSDNEKGFREMNQPPDKDPGLLVEKYKGFRKMVPKDISDNLFVINDRWMLVTGGRDSSFNSMTASWGGFGTAWSKPVAFMLIRDTRYAFEFLQKDSVYTLSFFDKKYKEPMQLIGSKSGRDTDKIKEAGFTPIVMPSGAVSFKEADLIVECKKLLSQPVDTTKVTSEDVIHWYREEAGVHNIFFGEIIGVWRK